MSLDQRFHKIPEVFSWNSQISIFSKLYYYYSYYSSGIEMKDQLIRKFLISIDSKPMHFCIELSTSIFEFVHPKLQKYTYFIHVSHAEANIYFRPTLQVHLCHREWKYFDKRKTVSSIDTEFQFFQQIMHNDLTGET